MKKQTKVIYGTLLLLTLWSVLIEPRWVAKREFDARLPLANQALGLKVAIVSDWHFTQKPLWRVMTPERAEHIVDQINAAQPDVILILGDLIAEEDKVSPSDQEPETIIAETLGKLKAKQGVYAVLGNHDWWYNGAKIEAALSAHGITVLNNEAQQLPQSPLWVVGIGDDITDHANPKLAFSKLPNNAPALVMMHDPISFAESPHANALSFAGHTHGGQVYLPYFGALVIPTRAPRSWAYGWVQDHGNQLYVTSGLGVSILPIRLNMRPEWVLINI